MSTIATRQKIFAELYPKEPAFRWAQIERALFEPARSSVADITTLPRALCDTLITKLLWRTLSPVQVFTSKLDGTYKAVLQTTDDLRLETVLMPNKRGYWTMCVSSQVGCAMACSFCATGTMGLKRSLTSDEIVDQYRFWQRFLWEREGEKMRKGLANDVKEGSPVISNIVFMGMGEPLLNYEAVKKAIQLWLKYTELGPTNIMVSTVGILPQLERILFDPDWPTVRLAISLHSAIAETRKKIVPSMPPEFLDKLQSWAQTYIKKLGNKSHYLTFEYIMLQGVNDTAVEAKALGAYAARCGVRKINVIPYNTVSGKEFARSAEERIKVFKQIVLASGVDVTQRRNMGNDIAAACGQLVTQIGR